MARTKSFVSHVSSTRSQTLALQRLEEERALIAERDREYLRQKYSILEGSIDELELGEHQPWDEAFDKSSFERVKDEQHLSKNFNNKFMMDNNSISLTKDERNVLEQRFYQQASSTTNVQRQKRPLPTFDSCQYVSAEVLPLQSKFDDKGKPSEATNRQIDNTLKPMNRTIAFNLIQPEKLQFYDPYQAPESSLSFQQFHSDSLGQPQASFSNIELDSKNTEFQPNYGQYKFNFGDVPKKAPINYGFQYQEVPPKMDFNNFGFSTVQPVQSNSQSYNYAFICQSHVDLTPNQIAARHTMNKRLPKFFGEPAKWQIFESAFINATTSCGLSNAENLSRLMDCLDGKAMEAVKCRLLHPDSVPRVMDTLRLMYGRPELIIHSLLEEIEKTVSPKSDDLGSLIKFAISVQNLCSTIESYKADEHLRNPTLMKALTDKLPSQIQLTWAIYKHNIMGEMNLSTLSNWLYGLATVASDVVAPVEDSSSNKKARKEAENHKKSKRYHYGNVQLDGHDVDDSLDNISVSSMTYEETNQSWSGDDGRENNSTSSYESSSYSSSSNHSNSSSHSDSSSFTTKQFEFRIGE